MHDHVGTEKSRLIFWLFQALGAPGAELSRPPVRAANAAADSRVV
jgi:hypothetical protein